VTADDLLEVDTLRAAVQLPTRHERTDKRGVADLVSDVDFLLRHALTFDHLFISAKRDTAVH
jgi:hypothetical protein